MGPSRDSPVEAVIRQMRPRTLFTVPGGARFEVDNLAPDAVELLFGGSKTRTVIRWTCLEGIPAFLHEKGWVEIGATHSVTVKPGTLEAYLEPVCGAAREDMSRRSSRKLTSSMSIRASRPRFASRGVRATE